MPKEQRDELARLSEAMRAAARYRPPRDQTPTVLSLPFQGSWLAANTPARRVPSHGTHFLGQTYAIDFVAVDTRRRTAATRDWRTVLGTEPADRFRAFGQPILAPADGHITAMHDGEPDHSARRTPVTVLPYLFTQGARLRRGLNAVVGNHVILALSDEGPYLALAHLKAGSVRVRCGEAVATGQPIAACGNSGNTTQPHLHIQVMDSPELLAARGLPMAFRDYRAWSRGADQPRTVTEGVPGHRERVAPLAQGGLMPDLLA
jgi:hypothetical protein